MKKLISMLLALTLVCCLLPVTVFASDIASGDCGERVTWRIEHDGSLFITGKGEMDDYELGTAPWYAYRDSITCVYIEHTVTYVGDYAFADCENLTEVMFLGDKPEIGSRIFQNNPVVNVYYPAYCDGWEYYDYLYGAEDINWISYGGCEHDFVASVEAPSCEGRGWTDYTCSLCDEYYQTDYLPNLGHEFSGEYVLLWEASCEWDRCLGDYCIRNCGCVDMIYEEGTALGHNYVDGVCTRCGETGGAISGESGVTGTWGDNLTWSLDEDGLLIISGEGKMAGAEDYHDELGWYFPWKDYYDQITAVVIAEGVTTVAEGAFTDCPAKEVSLPETMTKIGTGAFADSGLVSLVIPDSVTSFGMSAFYGCEALTSVKLPAGLEFAGEGVFGYCTSLTDVVMPEMPNYDIESHSSLSLYALFEGCSALTDIDFVTFPAITEFMFAWCGSLEEIAIPEGVEAIWSYAFRECENLTSVTIPASVTSIGISAFDDCSSLAEIRFEGDAPALEGGIFGNVAAIAYYPDGNDTWTEAVMAEFGGDITWIAYEEVTYPLSGTCGDNLTWNLDENGTMTISGTGEMYDYAEWWVPEGRQVPWSQTDIFSLIIEEGVTHIGANAFSVSTLTSVSFADSVVSIGEYAFYFCYDLTEITLPENLTSVGDQAFAWSGLKEVTIPGSLKTLGEAMFCFSQQLETVVLEEGVEVISDGAFNCCTYLTDITIPDTVTTIGSRAFAECHSLRSITIPASVTSVGDAAFYTDTGEVLLESVWFCGDAPDFGEDVFLFATAFCYYPAGNDTWTSVIENTYGGEVTWIPYEPVGEFLPGDMSGDGVIDDNDVAQLLWYTLFPDAYEIQGNADFNDDGVVDDADVAYLLWHTLFPEAYPIG